MSSSEAITAKAEKTIWLFYVQAALMVGYVIVAFVLPEQVNPYFSEAAHIAALHAVLFLVILVLFGASARSLHGADADQLSEFFPLTAVLADCPLAFVTLSNAILLPILGVEAWLRDEMGSRFSVLLMVQMLAVAEVTATSAVAFIVTWRLIQYYKVSKHSSGTTSYRKRAMSFSKSPSNGALLGGGAEYGLGYAREASSVGHHLLGGGDTSFGGMMDGGISPSGGGGGMSASVAQFSMMDRSASYATPAKPRGGTYAETPDSEPPATGGGGPPSAVPNSSHLSWRATAQTPGVLALETPHHAAAPSTGGGSGMLFSPLGHGGFSGGGGGGLPFATPAHTNKLVERVRELTARETELSARVAAMARELEKAAGSKGTPGADTARLLRSAAEEAAALQAANRALNARCDALEERVAYYESELRRANADTTRLRGQLKDEKRKGEKLFASLDVEKEANAAAQAALQDLKARLGNYATNAAAPPPSYGGGGGGNSSSGGGSSSSSGGGSAGGGSTNTAAITEALQRSASRTSFAYSPATGGAGGGGGPGGGGSTPTLGLLGSPPALVRGSFNASSQRQLLAAATRNLQQQQQQQQYSPQAYFSPVGAAGGGQSGAGATNNSNNSISVGSGVNVNAPAAGTAAPVPLPSQPPPP